METVLAVLVLYKSKLDESNTFISLTDCLKSAGLHLFILIYDNSPTPMNLKGNYSEWDINYFHDPENSGISRAYNHAVGLAKQMQKSWLLYLDQDTLFPINAITAYKNAINGTNNMTLYAPKLVSGEKLISPFKTGLGNGKILESISSGEYSFEEVMPINSGMLISTELVEKCGGYNEDFAVDYSDFAFIHRLKNFLPKFHVLDLECEHQFSGFDLSDKNASLKRFRNFCSATLLYKSTIEPGINSFMIITIRSVRLALGYKSLSFIKVAVSYLLKGK